MQPGDVEFLELFYQRGSPRRGSAGLILDVVRREGQASGFKEAGEAVGQGSTIQIFSMARNEAEFIIFIIISIIEVPTLINERIV
jgi:hypothetical protein